MQGTADFRHHITHTVVKQANSVFHYPTAFDTTVDVLDTHPSTRNLTIHRLLFIAQTVATWFLRRQRQAVAHLPGTTTATDRR